MLLAKNDDDAFEFAKSYVQNTVDFFFWPRCTLIFKQCQHNSVHRPDLWIGVDLWMVTLWFQFLMLTILRLAKSLCRAVMTRQFEYFLQTEATAGNYFTMFLDCITSVLILSICQLFRHHYSTASFIAATSCLLLFNKYLTVSLHRWHNKCLVNHIFIINCNTHNLLTSFFQWSSHLVSRP